MPRSTRSRIVRAWRTCSARVAGVKVIRLLRHHGRTPAGVVARVIQRILTLTTAIWHNDQSGQPVLRSLTAYDH
ncbi:hypothetical protein ACFLIM_25200 [Nonomuraea sp. M3C6]|uniref:Transposase n=1 Tax=Nonomuraea marmarensis TaxID=3351344 RepID=A0ABW7AGJ4_9ACTN